MSVHHNFWVRLDLTWSISSRPSEWSRECRENLESLHNLFNEAGAEVVRYGLWQNNGLRGLKLLFKKEHRDVVKRVLIQCFLEEELLEECWIGQQRLAWDYNTNRPFIENPGRYSRRYLDQPDAAPQPAASTPMPVPPQVACLTEVVQ